MPHQHERTRSVGAFGRPDDRRHAIAGNRELEQPFGYAIRSSLAGEFDHAVDLHLLPGSSAFVARDVKSGLPPYAASCSKGTKWRQQGLVIELLRENTLVETVSPVEQHGHRDASILRNVDRE